MSKLNSYTGSIDLIAGVRQKNNGTFPLMDANAIQTREDGTRLDTEIDRIKDASSTTPKANGDTASAGTEDAWARGDHVHPSQASVSGNAGTATKLKTARNIQTNLGSSTAASFDGTADITPGVTGTLPIDNGGTGASDPATARSNLGAAASVHTHEATDITEDATHRFVTDTEKSTWNAKASTDLATQTAAGLLSSDDKVKLDNLDNNIDESRLIRSKSGSTILIDDISPVTHEMEVKISSDTVTDLTAVKVSRCGKNLLSNLNYIEPQNLKTEIGYSKKIHLKAGFSYTFSIASISNATYWRFAAHIYENGIMVSAGDNNLQSTDWFTGNISMYGPKNQNYFLSQSNQTVLKNITYIITALKDCEICFGLYLGDASVDTICNNVQIELGTTSTEYEPYITPTEYTPNADGTVNGVTSLYPNTNLITDTDGVIIDCKYLTKSYTEIAGSTNLRNGSSIGSTRSIGSTKEDSSYKLGKYAMAEGLGTQSGAKAFTIVGVDKTNKTYTLDSVEGLAIGDVYSAHVLYTTGSSSQGENYGKITAINGNVVTVDNLFCENDFATADSYTDDGFDNEKNMFRIISKPNIGTRFIADAVHSEGVSTKALSKGSHAEGKGTVAYGSWSHAEGNNTKAGYGAHAEGSGTTASGFISHAEGSSTTSSGGSSHAEGIGTTASGGGSHAEGNKTKAIGYVSHAEGSGTEASETTAHAEGDKTVASGYTSHAEGNSTTASGGNSHAEGYNTIAYGDTSHAEGNGTSANSNAHAEGIGTEATGSPSHAEGTNTTASGGASHAEGNKTKAIGYVSHAEGSGTEASGTTAHAEGDKTVASGYTSHAEGNSTTASGGNSHAEGYNTIASKDSSHAEGKETKAIGYVSHAEGSGTEASGPASHAEGIGTEATGSPSHAEGTNTTASGGASHAEGNKTKAIGYAAHAEGAGTEATGAASHTEGRFTVASSVSSHAEGDHTTASSESQHVQGKFNIDDTNQKYADIVGNGTADDARSNAYTLDWEGNGWYSGDVYVGSTSGTNKDEGSKKLATEEYVNGELDKKANSSHEHNYAGSSSAGGAATSAEKLQTARNISITGGATAAAKSFDGTANVVLNVTSIDGSKITGVIPLSSIPKGAQERLIIVSTNAARLALTSEDAQNGDVVKVQDTGIMYYIVNDTLLGGDRKEDAFAVFTAGAASSVDWSGITNKPIFKDVATSGKYTDLTDTPNFATVATSGKYSDLSGTPVLASVATSGKYSDLSGTPVLASVATSGKYSDLSGTPSIPNASDATPKVAGTAAAGSETTWSRADHVHPAQTNITGNAGSATKAVKDNKDQQIDATYIKSISVSGKIITITKGDNTTSTITTQDTVSNAFGKVVINGTTISADAATDSLNIEAGDNINITPDATNDKVTISADNPSTTYNATIGTEWAGNEAPYTQTITITGITVNDTPIVDIITNNSDYEALTTQLEEFGSIYRITTAANSITVYTTKKTTVEIPIQLKCVK